MAKPIEIADSTQAVITYSSDQIIFLHQCPENVESRSGVLINLPYEAMVQLTTQALSRYFNVFSFTSTGTPSIGIHKPRSRGRLGCECVILERFARGASGAATGWGNIS